MGRLDGFANMGFVQQISLLDTLETEATKEALPELLALCEQPLGDEAVDQAVRDTTGALLRLDGAGVCEGLRTDSPIVRRLCLRAAAVVGGETVARELERLAGVEKDPEMLADVLVAVVKVGAKQAPGLLRRYARHPNQMIAAQAIEGLGECRDQGAVKFLARMVEEAGADDRYEWCDLPTAAAVESLGKIGGEGSLAFLAAAVHHRNPAVRQLVARELHRAGESAVGPLALQLSESDPDLRILAANALGEIGLGVVALEKVVRSEAEVNVRFAVYEALGKMAGREGLDTLIAGLEDADESVVLAVVSALDQRSAGAEAVRRALGSGGDGAERVARALVTAGAKDLLAAAAADRAGAERVGAAAQQVGADATRRRVAEILTGAGHGDLADEVLAAAGGASKDQPRLLAVDDSKSMLRFYEAVASGLGYAVETAPDGRAALTLLQLGVRFDLIVTDLNMPEMDGITLTRELRKLEGLADVPVLMVTTESQGAQIDLARKAGVTDFAVKPLTPQEFGQRLETSRKV
ncbi:MAG: response regulator [Deferrisomatales bacterium]|nr:response regulator [Deferrisomatales bacterium]